MGFNSGFKGLIKYISRLVRCCKWQYLPYNDQGFFFADLVAIVYVLLGISRRQYVICRRLETMYQFHLRRLEVVYRLLPAFEDGTDTWFRNVGKLHTDAGEIRKRTYTIFKSRRKLEIYNLVAIVHLVIRSKVILGTCFRKKCVL